MRRAIYNLINGHITEDVFKKVFDYVNLKITDKCDLPPIVISCDDSTVGTLGNFSASTGKPKSKKTYNVSAIVAAAISGKTVLKYKVTLPHSKNKVLYIDTEQGRYHCQRVLARILTLADCPLDKDSNQLDFLMLREYTPEQRREIIGMALKHDEHIGMLVIDGIRDLVRDINNSSEAEQVMNDLMRWSSWYDIHIHTVLHLNKGDDNTRGHLGTELNNKAETVLQIVKCRENSNMSEVRVTHIRDKEFQPFAFQINSQKLPELVYDYVSDHDSKTNQKTYDKFTVEEHRQAIELTIGDNKPLGFAQMLDVLTKGYGEYGYERGRSTMVALMKHLMSIGLLIKEGKTYRYSPTLISYGNES